MRILVALAVFLFGVVSANAADIVGYSLGGMVVMKLLARHPSRVKTAVVGGMISGTVLAVALVPLFFVIVQRLFHRRAPIAAKNDREGS